MTAGTSLILEKPALIEGVNELDGRKKKPQKAQEAHKFLVPFVLFVVPVSLRCEFVHSFYERRFFLERPIQWFCNTLVSGVEYVVPAIHSQPLPLHLRAFLTCAI
ncbi:MAG TPA: hypothetical protein VE422_00265 [Terriglobia bacterium]|nr:hypothetical protein [Terriglobia bacterium]